jgi:hypothetical protein
VGVGAIASVTAMDLGWEISTILTGPSMGRSSSMCGMFVPSLGHEVMSGFVNPSGDAGRCLLTAIAIHYLRRYKAS